MSVPMNLLLSIKGKYCHSGISTTKIWYFFQSTNYFIRIKISGCLEVGWSLDGDVVAPVKRLVI